MLHEVAVDTKDGQLTELSGVRASSAHCSAAPSGTSTPHIKIQRTPLGFQRPTGDAPLPLGPLQKKLSALESSITAAQAELKTAQATRKEAGQKSSSATRKAAAAREEADGCKDKTAKDALVEAAEAAEATAASASGAEEMAIAALEQASERLRKLTKELKGLYMRYAAESIASEGRANQSLHEAVITQVGEQIKKSLEDDATVGAARRRLERRERGKEAKADLIDLRDRVDPHFYRDLEVASTNPTHLHGGDLKVGGPIAYFGDPPKVPGKHYPTPTPPLPNGVGLRSIAKYKPKDDLVLDKGTPNEQACHIRTMELGDRTMPPGPLRMEHEVVYQVMTDSTTTTIARSAPKWVVERRLSPRDTTAAVMPGGFRGPGWHRKWPRDRSFEFNSFKAKQQLNKEVATVRRLDAERQEAAALGIEAKIKLRKGETVPDMVQMRARASLHGLASDIDGLDVPVGKYHGPPIGVPQHHHISPSAPTTPRGGHSPRSQPMTPRSITSARPMSAAASPRSGGAGSSSDLIFARRGSTDSGRQSPSPPRPDAGGYVGVAPENPTKRNLYIQGAKPRPGSAVRPGSPGRKPTRPYSALARAGAPTPSSTGKGSFSARAVRFGGAQSMTSPPAEEGVRHDLF